MYVYDCVNVVVGFYGFEGVVYFVESFVVGDEFVDFEGIFLVVSDEVMYLRVVFDIIEGVVFLDMVSDELECCKRLV